MLGGLFTKRGQKMICGVRFCGGCNPRYERGVAFESIKQNLQGEVEFLYAEEGVPYDVLLVIGGCTNCCASYDQFIAKRGVIKIWHLEDLEKVIKILKDFE